METENIGLKNSEKQPPKFNIVLRLVLWFTAAVLFLGMLSVGIVAATLPGCNTSSCHGSPSFIKQTNNSGHASVPCIRCHVVPDALSRVGFAYDEVFGMTLKWIPVDSRTRAAVNDQTCLSCHSTILKKITVSNGLKINHITCDQGRVCTDCHSNTAHGNAVAWQRVPEMEQCLDCHTTQKVINNCDTCHTGQKTQQQRLVNGSWQVTHGPNWKTTHGMGDLKTCNACHSSDFCVKCHGIELPHNTAFFGKHGTVAIANPSSCITCHKPQYCDECHGGVQMPHPKDFTPNHAQIVKKESSINCLRCHEQQDCENCHTDHIHPGNLSLPIPSTNGGAK